MLQWKCSMNAKSEKNKSFHDRKKFSSSFRIEKLKQPFQLFFIGDSTKNQANDLLLSYVVSNLFGDKWKCVKKLLPQRAKSFGSRRRFNHPGFIFCRESKLNFSSLHWKASSTTWDYLMSLMTKLSTIEKDTIYTMSTKWEIMDIISLDLLHCLLEAGKSRKITNF